MISFHHMSYEEDYVDSITDESVHSEKSPSISGIPTTCVTKDYLFIQMEFCSNRTLKDEIYSDEGIPTDRAWILFREILEGLNYIHGKKTIHRDLKPGNIFLDSNFRAKIVMVKISICFCIKGISDTNHIISSTNDEIFDAFFLTILLCSQIFF